MRDLECEFSGDVLGLSCRCCCCHCKGPGAGGAKGDDGCAEPAAVKLLEVLLGKSLLALR